MRIEPEYGQDTPVECTSAKVETGSTVYRFIDRGDHLEIMVISHDGRMSGILVNGQSGNVIRVCGGQIPA